MSIKDLFAILRRQCELYCEFYPGFPLPEAPRQTYFLQVDLLESIAVAGNVANYEELLDRLQNGAIYFELVERFVEAGGWYNPEVVSAVRQGYPRIALAIKTTMLRDLERSGLLELIHSLET